MLKYLVLGCALFMLSACGDGQRNAPDSAPMQAVEAAVETGVSLDLAKARVQNVSDINYALTFSVPAEASAPIRADEILTFELKAAEDDLQLDFREAGDKLERLVVNGQSVPIKHLDEHLILPAGALKQGENTVEIAFIAGDTSLNRNPNYLYTLFVPDRARTAFPVFDQPNLKATYDLVLDLPESWAALGNGLLDTVEEADGRRVHRFKRTDRLSSYLFSFVAGEFKTVTRTVDGRQMTMLHRETDVDKVARNLDDIFQAHADALAWLEDYTGIDYPFAKFDFALIPTFQYGGMEHVGAIQYRASTLLLDAEPSDPQRLNRANLIAHETAHMWFGDLVTMDWFNDVWTKEVFANFMAAKIVNPSFPDIDHDLNFLLRSYPAAYAVDRTTGANPIRQDLPNLNEAGTLYGGIIYNKAPIMMRQLEILLGEDVFRDGMREYLTTYAGGNATWPDLIAILDKRSDLDLVAWSQVWVNTAGRPRFTEDFDGQTGALSLVQSDDAGKDRLWTQRLRVHRLPEDGAAAETYTIDFDAAVQNIPVSLSGQGARLLYNSEGEGYGIFPVNMALIGAQWSNMSDLQKGAQLINMFEQMLEGSTQVAPSVYFDFLQARLDEPNQLLLNTMLGQLRRTYWSFLTEEARLSRVSAFEDVLWTGVLETGHPASTRKLYLSTLQDVALGQESLEKLLALLNRDYNIAGITLSDRERSNLSALLAIKLPRDARDILGKQAAWLTNPDAKRRFRFMMPALSASVEERDAFFASLMDVENRAIESWVVDALAYLHHPQRTASSQRYIAQSLEVLEEIQVTGDIFFPARWTAGNLGNYNTPEAARIVREFLAARPDYNYQLKLKVLQAADMAFRAEAILKETSGSEQ